MFTARIAEAAFCPSLVEFFFTSRKKFQRYQSLDRRGLDRATTMTTIHNQQVIGPIEDSLHQSLG
jgi:hypothetical protein